MKGKVQLTRWMEEDVRERKQERGTRTGEREVMERRASDCESGSPMTFV
jgi:hypothetical protein